MSAMAVVPSACPSCTGGHGVKHQGPKHQVFWSLCEDVIAVPCDVIVVSCVIHWSPMCVVSCVIHWSPTCVVPCAVSCVYNSCAPYALPPRDGAAVRRSRRACRRRKKIGNPRSLPRNSTIDPSGRRQSSLPAVDQVLQLIQDSHAKRGIVQSIQIEIGNPRFIEA